MASSKYDPDQPGSSSPDIDLGEGNMGHQTLNDVKDDLRAVPWPRPPLMTLGYDEVPLDAAQTSPQAPPQLEPWEDPPGAGILDATALRPAQPSSPDIEVGEARPGMATLAAIEEELAPPKPKSAASTCDALELLTFLVPRELLPPDSPAATRRAFVAERFARRLPCPIRLVRRIDAKAFRGGEATLLRVWCPVPLPE